MDLPNLAAHLGPCLSTQFCNAHTIYLKHPTPRQTSHLPVPYHTKPKLYTLHFIKDQVQQPQTTLNLILLILSQY